MIDWLLLSVKKPGCACGRAFSFDLSSAKSLDGDAGAEFYL